MLFPELEDKVTTKTVPNHCSNTLTGLACHPRILTKRQGVTGQMGQCCNSTCSIIAAKLVQGNVLRRHVARVNLATELLQTW